MATALGLPVARDVAIRRVTGDCERLIKLPTDYSLDHCLNSIVAGDPLYALQYLFYKSLSATRDSIPDVLKVAVYRSTEGEYREASEFLCVGEKISKFFHSLVRKGFFL